MVGAVTERRAMPLRVNLLPVEVLEAEAASERSLERLAVRASS